MVAVAQLVERWIVIPVVVGSIPISHPIYCLFTRYQPRLKPCVALWQNARAVGRWHFGRCAGLTERKWRNW